MDDTSEVNAATSGASEHEMIKALTRRARLAPSAALGDSARKAKQRMALLQQREAKSSFQDKLTIGNVAEAVGLTDIAFSDPQLRGALLTVVEASRDPEKLVAYEVAGKAWLDSRRPARDPGSFRVYVTAATIGAELAQACNEMRLSRVDMPEGYKGRLVLAQALELGRRYTATVYVKLQGKQLQLVNRGEVDATVLGKLTAEAGMDGTTAQIAGSPEDDALHDADASVAAPATSEAPAMAANTNDEDAAPAEAEADIPRPYHEPVRPLHRPKPR